MKNLLIINLFLFTSSSKKLIFVFILSDEGKYEGKWKDGKSHGQGTFTFSDGNKGVGEFRDNKPWNITTYNIHGNIIGKYVNGIKQ